MDEWPDYTKRLSKQSNLSQAQCISSEVVTGDELAPGPNSVLSTTHELRFSFTFLSG